MHIRKQAFVVLLGSATLAALLLIVPGLSIARAYSGSIVQPHPVANTSTQWHVQQAKNAQFFLAGSYILKATEIDGSYARLHLLPDPTHPTLTFQATTLRELQLSHPIDNATSLTISSSGEAQAFNVTIKTSLLSNVKTALASFVNKADLLTLALGGTVKNLKMKNVKLKIDRYLQANSLTMPNVSLSISSASP